MLQQQTVPARALELLKAIQSNAFFEGTRLVGGTALAMQIGHRISIDLDFFGDFPHDHNLISQELSAMGSVVNLRNTKSIKIYKVDDVKIDFVNYQYNWLEDAGVEQNFCLAGKKDIAAMKISAITGRGSKKYFVDVYALLNFFSLAEMMQWFIEKFPDGSLFLAQKSLIYFDDADEEKDPNMLVSYDWKKIKKRIVKEFETLKL